MVTQMLLDLGRESLLRRGFVTNPDRGAPPLSSPAVECLEVMKT